MISILTTDISETFVYLPQTIGTFALIWIVLIVRRIILAKNSKSEKKYFYVEDLFMALLFGYIVFVAYVVFFSRLPGSRFDVDLVPGSSWGIDSQGDAYNIENILLFIPLGFLICVSLKNMPPLVAVIICCFVSVLIEFFQHKTGRGFCQADDIITNTIGALIGVILAKIVNVNLIKKQRSL